MYIVSACLVGDNCKYNGENNWNEEVIQFLKGKEYVAVCPEVAGGLPVPRQAAEIRDGKVWGKEGADYTEAFHRGANEELERCMKEAEETGEVIELAILQPRSPSCGSGRVYDGTFSGVLIPGDGVFAGLLREHGIKVVTADEIGSERKEEVLK
ncbi:MAG: DUF523 domain-containing protein [Anaerovoracaceae bacterium]|jgi:uncharacterized protein YbbK (DUF523 family)